MYICVHFSWVFVRVSLSKKRLRALLLFLGLGSWLCKHYSIKGGLRSSGMWFSRAWRPNSTKSVTPFEVVFMSSCETLFLPVFNSFFAHSSEWRWKVLWGRCGNPLGTTQYTYTYTYTHIHTYTIHNTQYTHTHIHIHIHTHTHTAKDGELTDTRAWVCYGLCPGIVNGS